MFTCKVIFGSEAYCGDEEQEPSEYSFNTQAELDAFLTGLDTGCGWMEYEVVSTDQPAS